MAHRENDIYLPPLGEWRKLLEHRGAHLDVPIALELVGSVSHKPVLLQTQSCGRSGLMVS